MVWKDMKSGTAFISSLWWCVFCHAEQGNEAPYLKNFGGRPFSQLEKSSGECACLVAFESDLKGIKMCVCVCVQLHTHVHLNIIYHICAW